MLNYPAYIPQAGEMRGNKQIALIVGKSIADHLEMKSMNSGYQV
jgi:hypothetical protein